MEHYIETFPDGTIEIANKKYLYFGGTAYLGLQTDKTFHDIFITNLKTYGTAYGASRKSNVRLTIYDKTERFLASWIGSESCITLSSGYLAAQLVANSFNEETNQLFYAPNCHTALYLSGTDSKLQKSYYTYTSLNLALRKHIASKNSKIPVVFIDAIDFSRTNYPDFDGIRSLPLKDIILVVDDSHGIGIIGDEGAGVYPILSKLKVKELLVCGSLGKALGISAGAIFGTNKRIDKLCSTEFFAGASPAAPVYLASLLEAWKLIEEKRVFLKKNIITFSEGIKNLSAIRSLPDYPVFSYTDSKLTKYLEENSIIVTDFPYPNEEADATARIVLSASHSTADIALLIGHLSVYFSKI